MPQKACEIYIFHVMAYSIFFEMTHFIFGSFSVLQLTACIFFEIPRFFMFVFFEMPHFSYLILKISLHENIQEIFIIKEVMLGEDLKLSDVGH